MKNMKNMEIHGCSYKNHGRSLPQVASVPQFHLFKGGKLVSLVNGANPDALESAVKEHAGPRSGALPRVLNTASDFQRIRCGQKCILLFDRLHQNGVDTSVRVWDCHILS